MALVFKIQKKVIEDIIKRGKSVNFPLFGVKYIKNNTKTDSFVFIVSKKEEKKSHDRNTIRRRTRESFREVFRESETGFQGVVFCKKTLKDIAFLDIVKMVKEFQSSLNFDK